MASEPASPRAEAGAVVCMEQPLSVRVRAVTRAAANPVPIDFVFLDKAGHSSVAGQGARCAAEKDYT
ncbi:hypothetical protein GCM10015535_14370 [Streptomyces gelaticus]|uniref:Uncharacterized protein n=1 Tax=Streptomyces gelaticus TaxID=285446 RepID=A0ABQ2VTT0_9ACTN|nr:hypothetical protein GCM10015535_14370 [Streptomyces gelaticus]